MIMNYFSIIDNETIQITKSTLRTIILFTFSNHPRWLNRLNGRRTLKIKKANVFERKWNEKNWKEMKTTAMREMKGTAYCLKTIATKKKWKDIEEMSWNQMEMAVCKRKLKKSNDIPRKYTLSSLNSSQRISFHFSSFHIISIQIHPIFDF